MAFGHPERVHFIHGAVIAPPVFPKSKVIHRLAAAPQKGACSVVGGSVYQFNPGVGDTAKSDVEDSTLFAQLAATAKYKRGTREWYDTYTETLNKVGWTIQGLQFTQFKNASKVASVKDIVYDVLKGALSPDAYAACEASIKALYAPANESALKVFNAESSSGSTGGFQNGLVTQDQSGTVGQTIFGYYFTSSQEVKSTLDVSAKDDISSFWYATQTVTLDADIYSSVRDAIKNKLKQSILTLIDDVSL